MARREGTASSHDGCTFRTPVSKIGCEESCDAITNPYGQGSAVNVSQCPPGGLIDDLRDMGIHLLCQRLVVTFYIEFKIQSHAPLVPISAPKKTP